MLLLLSYIASAAISFPAVAQCCCCTTAIAAAICLLCSLCCLCCCFFLWLQHVHYPHVVFYRGCTLVLRPVPTSPGPGSCNCPSGVHRSCLASWRSSGHVCQHPTQLWRHAKCSRWVSMFLCSSVCLCLPASVSTCACVVYVFACLRLYLPVSVCESVSVPVCTCLESAFVCLSVV